MKKYVKSRVLSLAPRNSFVLRTAAFMACVSATFLVAHRDASAVPGIPLFPTFDLIQPARPEASPVLQPQQTLLVNQVAQVMQQSLPGAFVAPWTLPEAELDPSFRVSYWNPTQGYKNTSDAPWNYNGLLGTAIFDSPFAYAGKGISHSPQPIFLDPAALQALAGSAL